MTDFLEVKRSEIRTRLEKLAPAVEEYSRLQAAAAALASIDGAGPTKPAAKAPARRGRPRKSAALRSTAAKNGRNAAASSVGRTGRPRGSGRGQQALEAIQAQPGITISEIATEIGVAAQYLYRLLPPLQKEGKITKRGKGWHPSGG